jgi:hypothetical protein
LEHRLYDEMRDAQGRVREHCRTVAEWLAVTPAKRVAEKRREADLLFHRVGITFAVYGDEAGAERLIPFDTIPRIIPRAEWEMLERGLKQRVNALNRFLHDIYHDQSILKAGVMPCQRFTIFIGISGSPNRPSVAMVANRFTFNQAENTRVAKVGARFCFCYLRGDDSAFISIRKDLG